MIFLKKPSNHPCRGTTFCESGNRQQCNTCNQGPHFRIRRWEEEQGRYRTSVIALIAYALREDAAKSEEAGCDTHLTKPIKKTVLLAAIRQFARNSGH